MFLSTSILFLVSLFCAMKYKGVASAIISMAILFIYAFILKINPSPPPIEVPIVIISISLATSALELAGGLALLINLSEKLIYRYPSKITYIGPFISYFLTIFSGSGSIIFSILPVIAKVSKKIGVNPSKPLSGAVVAAHQGLIASPISSPFIVALGILSALGFSMKNLFILYLPATFLALFITCFILSKKKNPNIYELNKSETKTEIPDIKAKIATIIFFAGILFIMMSGWVEKIRVLNVNMETKTIISMTNTLTLSMFLISALIIIICKLQSKHLISSESFKNGIQASISILGISWLGNTFIEANKNEILNFMKILTSQNEWFFGLILFLFCIPLMSQSATLKLILPLGIALGIKQNILLGVIPAVNSLFILPTYPTMIIASQLDNTGNTKLGKRIFDHSFILPGFISTAVSTAITIIFVKIFY